MSTVCRHLLGEADASFATRVTGLERREGRWRLRDEGGADLGAFDAVVVSAPAPQTAAFLRAAAPAMAARAAAVPMAPCWAVMATFPQPLELAFDGAFVGDSPLSWVARNTSKPGRPAHDAWVLHASPAWSATALELDRTDVARRLLDAFAAALGGTGLAPAHLDAHRWLYALPTQPVSEPCLLDPERGLAACGDWCGGPRVEGAFLSGRAAAERLLTGQPGAHA
jgi:predicted NAD/FAD-dependent oxidoreductase